MVEQRESLAIGSDDSLYVGGAFVNPGIIADDECWARWNGHGFERLDTFEGDRVQKSYLT